MNQFLASTHKYSTTTENGAIAHSSTGSVLADQFSKAGSFRGREIKSVFVDQSTLDSTVGSLVALRFILYLRAITRKPKGLWFEGEDLLKGQGNRDESFKRFIWYLANKPEFFYDNLWLFIVCGSYKDLWELIGLAKENNVVIDEQKVFYLYATAFDSEKSVDDLALKYLPQIVSNKKANSVRAKMRNKIAKNFADYLALDARAYRQLKTTGKAHTWQQKISNGLFDQIDFGKISGKALSLITNGKFMSKHNLESKYTAWIEKQPTAKFTGYVYELFNAVQHNMPVFKKMTIDKQFEGLIKLVEDNEGAIKGNVWCALDTSNSMTSKIGDGKLTAYDVCVSLGIYFSTLNKGAFHKNVIMFDNTSKIKQLSGSFSDMANDIKTTTTAWGTTNFQSVIDEIIRIKKMNPNIPLEDYPQTLLVVSDMQFNPLSNPHLLATEAQIKTNYEELMSKLSRSFPSEWVKGFKMIWWDCSGRVTSNQPSTMEDGGTYVFSGFDGASISILLGGKAQKKNDKKTPSMEEVINDALTQEALLQVKA